MKRITAASLAVLSLAAPAVATPIGWTVDIAGPGPAVSPLMHGVFFEDINFGADGGLYAELVENRSFEHSNGLHAWREESRDGASGRQALSGDSPVHPNNPRFVRLDVAGPGGGYGLSNLGYGGIPVAAGGEYRFAIHARAAAGYNGGLIARIEDANGKPLAEGRIAKLATTWQRYKLPLASTGSAPDARLTVLADAPGQVDLDMISLFPKKTWMERENGLRADLVQKLADLKPGFMRFPGGCVVEGKTLSNAYRWKDTVGDIATRKQNWNRWEEVMANPGVKEYKQTCGLGFYEFFQLCEDIGASPVPVLNCGMSCQFQAKELVPMRELDPWVRDTLDLIEFANGPVTTKWGALRAEMGHPAPFRLTHLGIGNEQWGPGYFERYLVFYKALKARHPEITLITTSGPGVDDANWEYAWSRFRKDVPAEIVDEHYYRPPQWFLDHAARYDSYDRKGPKIFAGEFAAHRPDKAGALDAAVCEAAFMTGLLRNAGVVVMSCYAPLFAREGFVQWTPDLIWFDATRSMPTPSYHVQGMFGRNRPDKIVPSAFTDNSAAPAASGRIGVGAWRTQAEFKDIVVRDGSKELFRSGKGLDGWDRPTGQWEASGGVLRQTGDGEGAIALAGDPSWKDGTITLKARKTGGSEGFLILFHTRGADVSERCWWNIGGWGNTGHALEFHGEQTPVVRGKIENGRWYDIRIETKGDSVRCYLDNRLIHDIRRPAHPLVYGVAGINRKAGEVILQAANPSAEARELVITLKGWTGAKPAAGQVLTSASPDDRNTLDEPAKVAPQPVSVPVSGGVIRHTLPPWSHTVLRVPR